MPCAVHQLTVADTIEPRKAAARAVDAIFELFERAGSMGREISEYCFAPLGISEIYLSALHHPVDSSSWYCEHGIAQWAKWSRAYFSEIHSILTALHCPLWSRTLIDYNDCVFTHFFPNSDLRDPRSWRVDIDGRGTLLRDWLFDHAHLHNENRTLSCPENRAYLAEVHRLAVSVAENAIFKSAVLPCIEATGVGCSVRGMVQGRFDARSPRLCGKTHSSLLGHSPCADPIETDIEDWLKVLSLCEAVSPTLTIENITASLLFRSLMESSSPSSPWQFGQSTSPDETTPWVPLVGTAHLNYAVRSKLFNRLVGICREVKEVKRVVLYSTREPLRSEWDLVDRALRAEVVSDDSLESPA